MVPRQALAMEGKQQPAESLPGTGLALVPAAQLPPTRELERAGPDSGPRGSGLSTQRWLKGRDLQWFICVSMWRASFLRSGSGRGMEGVQGGGGKAGISCRPRVVF
jgi:hypothetical protein